jgi:Protein of unknown function (DUF3383)
MSATINTIPASQFVAVTPSVIGAGGSALQLIELMLTTNTRIPIGTVVSFPSLLTVQQYFGATTGEANSAAVYFLGTTISTATPAALLMAQYPLAAVGAYMRGGNISSLTLTQLQALSGVLTVTVDGTPVTSTTINLSGATSFSNASELITNALGLNGPTQAVATGSIGALFTATASGTALTTSAVTGVIHVGDVITGTGITGTVTIVSGPAGGGAGVYVTSASTTCSGAAVTATSKILDVTAVTSGTIVVGQEVTGAGIAGRIYITALGTGTGGVGTYTIVTAVQQVSSETLTMIQPTVTYDSVSGAFIVVSSTTGVASTMSFGSGTIAASLLLTSATGAVLSQGANAAVPGAFMTAVTQQTQDWATFQTLFDPDAGSGNAQKLLFAEWNNTQNNRYAYLAWDTDITPTQSNAATTSLGYIVTVTDDISGTVPIYEPVGSSLHLAAFVGGQVASLNFNATNGRQTTAFRSQTGIRASVTSQLAYTNLVANGYNSYPAVATANQQFLFATPGSISGPFEWIDSYVNQIWLNNQCQLALLTLLTQIGSIPYNPYGYGLIRTALTGGAGTTPIPLPPQSPVAAALNFGAIRQNVPLSSTEITAVNNLAGFSIDTVLATTGWYLLIQPATAQIRAARQSPTIILLYMDGESVQSLNLSSVLVQ